MPKRAQRRQLAPPPFKLRVDGVPHWLALEHVADVIRQPLTVEMRGSHAVRIPGLGSYQGGFRQRMEVRASSPYSAITCRSAGTRTYSGSRFNISPRSTPICTLSLHMVTTPSDGWLVQI